jgi:hypothetical protein
MAAIVNESGRDGTKGRRPARLTVGLTVATFLSLAGSRQAGGKQTFCSDTARALFAACRAGVGDDTLVRRAVCINASDAAKRAACLNQMRADRKEALQLCQDQRGTRLDTCKALGESRYDPDFSAALFDDPRNPTHPNPYFPLTVGNRWEYRAGTEVDAVEVVNETKLNAGVQCIVVRDLVSRDGFLAEATDDWYAPAKSGATWYFGEEVKDSEVFDGDDPKRPELVSIDGSFKAGRSGDKPGIIFLASPKVGDVYVEEASLGNAEDVTEVLSTTYSHGSGGPELDQLVPPELAALFCAAGDCVVTKNFSLLEPGIFARKYYARGVGVFLEVEPDESKAIRLVSCNFDSRCAMLTP